jgi:anti-sigma factor RsiW
MTCRTFRSNHVAFVDDLLCADDMVEMRRHLGQCTSCAAMDTRVRRSLLVMRNLPPIECSPDFGARLTARLAAEGHAGPSVRRSPLATAATYAALAAGLALAGYMAVEVSRTQAALDVAPVVAVAPMPDDEAFTEAAMAAAIPTGVPIWSAMLLVGQLPTQAATVELVQTSMPR